MIDQLPGTLHASAVRLSDVTILVGGPSGSGKSSLCRWLVATHEDASWIGDDQLCISIKNTRLHVAPHPNLAGKSEQRGVGIVKVPFEKTGQITHQILLEDGGEMSKGQRPILDGTWQPNLKAAAQLAEITIPTLSLPSLATKMDETSPHAALIATWLGQTAR